MFRMKPFPLQNKGQHVQSKTRHTTNLIISYNKLYLCSVQYQRSNCTSIAIEQDWKKWLTLFQYWSSMGIRSESEVGTTTILLQILTSVFLYSQFTCISRIKSTTLFLQQCFQIPRSHLVNKSRIRLTNAFCHLQLVEKYEYQKSKDIVRKCFYSVIFRRLIYSS